MEKVELVFDPDNAKAADYVRDRLSMFNSSRTGKSDYYPCTIFLKGEKGWATSGPTGCSSRPSGSTRPCAARAMQRA